VLLAERATYEGSLIGEGSLSYFCRASLPYGKWCSLSVPFEISSDDVLPNHRFVMAGAMSN
ncbi:hypothetical protein, partial [Pseudomonas syringae]